VLVGLLYCTFFQQFALHQIVKNNDVLSAGVFTENFVPPAKDKPCNGCTRSIHYMLYFSFVVSLLPTC
jgi:hypothetical protein